MSKTRVQLPDGRYILVPTEDPQIAARAAKIYYERNPTPPKKEKPKAEAPSLWQRFREADRKIGEYASPLAGQFVDGLLPNWGDEIYAAPRAVGAFLRGEDAGEAFDEAQQHYLRRQQRFERENPKAATVAEGTGLVGSLALPAGKVAQAATLPQKARTGAVVAGAYGTVTGAGAGDGIGERATNAAYMGGTAATVGAGMPFAGRGVGAADDWARMHLPGYNRLAEGISSLPGRAVAAYNGRPYAPPSTRAASQANQMVYDTMGQGNIRPGASPGTIPSSPQAVASEVSRRQAAGVPAMPADITPELRNLSSWSSRGMGPGQAMVRERIAERKAGEGTRVRGYVQDTMPTTPDPELFVEQTQRAMKDAAKPLYDEAYSQPMFRTEGVQAIEQTPAFQAALPQAYTNIRNQIDAVTGRPKDPAAMGFRQFDGDPNGLPPNVPYFKNPDGPGYIAWDKGLSVEGYDQVVRAMRASADAQGVTNPITGRTAMTTNSVHVGNRANDLRDELASQNTPYREAVERYADDSATVNAFQQGRDVSRLTGPEIAAQQRAMSPEFNQTWATGAGTSLADDAAAYGSKYPAGDTANRIRQSLGDEAKQKAMGEMTGDPASLAKLQDLLEMERQAAQTFKDAFGNSQTRMRQAFDDDMGDKLAGIPQSWPEAARRFIGFLGSKVSPEYRNQVRDRVAEIVTSTDAKTITEIIQAVEAEAARNEQFRQLLTNSGIAVSGLYGRSVQPMIDDQP